MQAPVGIGLVGVGAFGEFCLAAFDALPEVRIAAVCDTDAERVERFATQYRVPAYTSLDALLEDSAVEIVALNTPPYLHGAQGLAVLNSGRHLFCEKPLALTVEEGEALINAGWRNERRITVDYVMRHNPLWAAATRLRESGAIGALLHMDLVNHAAGLNLHAAHWFWDKARSGGIWIEHGVHFFDAFAWVAGIPGTVTSAQSLRRADGVEDRVEALARYGDTAAHFYHGFTHSSVTEQTTVTLTFEHGYVTLREWVPTRMEIVTPVALETLAPLLPGELSTTTNPEGRTQINAVLPEGKSAVYRASIQAGMSALAAAVRDPGIELAVTGAHGLASLQMAAQAEVLAKQGE